MMIFGCQDVHHWNLLLGHMVQQPTPVELLVKHYGETVQW